MTSGTEDTIPLYENLNAYILLKLSDTDGTNSLSFVVKNTHITARLKYIEHSTPNKDENLSALAFLGKDIGNNIPIEKMTAQRT